MSDLTRLTLRAALEGLKARDFSSEEITKAFVANIEAANPRLNAYVVQTTDKALAMARASDVKLAKGEGGALEGAPLGIKDLFCTDGVQTTAGSNMLRGFVPPYESTVTANLWRDGAVMLGKLNMDEFAMGSSNETSAFGPVVNPWKSTTSNADLTPGGQLGRLGLGRRRRPLPGGHRLRHRRFDPSARRLHGHGRHQAHLRPRQPLRHGRLRQFAGPGRPDHEDRRGRRHPAAFDVLV